MKKFVTVKEKDFLRSIQKNLFFTLATLYTYSGNSSNPFAQVYTPQRAMPISGKNAILIPIWGMSDRSRDH